MVTLKETMVKSLGMNMFHEDDVAEAVKQLKAKITYGGSRSKLIHSQQIQEWIDEVFGTW